LYVTSNGSDNVLRFNGITGQFVDVFASGGGLVDPVDLAFAPDGAMYVTDQRTNRVLRYEGITGGFLDDFVAAGPLEAPGGLFFWDPVPEPQTAALIAFAVAIWGCRRASRC
jgi:DNA-binding beta-propeller fold protein YncE